MTSTLKSVAGSCLLIVIVLALVASLNGQTVNGNYAPATCTSNPAAACTSFMTSTFALAVTNNAFDFFVVSGSFGISRVDGVFSGSGSYVLTVADQWYTGAGTFVAATGILSLSVTSVNTSAAVQITLTKVAPSCSGLSCTSCINNVDCGWCRKNGGSCMAGSFAGPAGPATCSAANDWVWDTCNTCEQAATCGDCFTNLRCVWCTNSSTCIPGSPIGPTQDGVCDKWSYGNCIVTGILALVIVCSVAGVAIIIIIVVCCCCCRRRRQALLDQEGNPEADEPPKAGSLTALQSRRKELEAKYGVKPRE